MKGGGFRLRISTCPACGTKPVFVPSEHRHLGFDFKLEHTHPVCRLAPVVVYHRSAKAAAKRMATELCDRWITSKVTG